MNRRVRISRPAERDIEDILHWTQEHFGERARSSYEALLARASSDIAVGPTRVGSMARPEIAPEVRTYHLSNSRDRVPAHLRRVRKPRHFLLYRPEPIDRHKPQYGENTQSPEHSACRDPYCFSDSSGQRSRGEKNRTDNNGVCNQVKCQGAVVLEPPHYKRQRDGGSRDRLHHLPHARTWPDRTHRFARGFVDSAINAIFVQCASMVHNILKPPAPDVLCAHPEPSGRFQRYRAPWRPMCSASRRGRRRLGPWERCVLDARPGLRERG